MKLLEQILSEMGADTLKSFTVIPRFGGYFRSVKSINDCKNFFNVFIFYSEYKFGAALAAVVNGYLRLF